MKILFLAAANSIHTVRWVNALSMRNHQIILVSEQNHRDKAKLILDAVKVIYLKFGGSKGYYLNVPELRKVYRNEKPDVINVHYASGYGTLARLAKLSNYILNVWGSDVYDFPCQSRVKELILRKNLKAASVLASTSCNMAEQTKKYAGDRNIEVTPFGVDLEKFYAYSDKEESEKFVFGIVKTLTAKYGISMVIKAFALFNKQLDDKNKGNVLLRIYGRGELLDELKELVKECGIEDKVYFEGYINNVDVPKALNEMNVFLLGSESESESFGVAAVEAMACELPVVATNVSGFREVIKDGETGFLVKTNAVEAMCEYMQKLYGDKALRQKMGKNGRKRVMELYDWNKNVDTMISIYENAKQ